MGITCIEYLTQKRIERARKLLERTEMKHQAIAQAVGYASVYYFSLQFKKQTGETPGQYRKRVGKKMIRTIKAKIIVCFGGAIIILFLLFGMTGYQVFSDYQMNMQKESQEKLAESLCSSILFSGRTWKR